MFVKFAGVFTQDQNAVKSKHSAFTHEIFVLDPFLAKKNVFEGLYHFLEADEVRITLVQYPHYHLISFLLIKRIKPDIVC